MGRPGNEANISLENMLFIYFVGEVKFTCGRESHRSKSYSNNAATRYSAFGYQQQIVGIAHRLGVLQGVVLRQVSQNEPESISERPGEGAGHAPQTPPPDTRFAHIAHLLWPV